MASVHDEDGPRNGRRYLLDPAKKLAGQRKTVERGVSGEVPRRSRSIGDKAMLSRTGGRNKHDRNCACLLLEYKQGTAATRHDHIGLQSDKVRHIGPQAFEVVGRPAGINFHVAAVGPTQSLQPLNQRVEACLSFHVVLGQRHQHADPPHTFALLRMRHQRPSSGHAAKPGDESRRFIRSPRRRGQAVTAAR